MASASVLFICWGNICRSPTAEGIMRRCVDQAGMADVIEIDSAGVSAEHHGSPPDRRSLVEAEKRGIDLRELRARKVTDDDWERFDLLLVADEMVERRLRQQAPPGADLTKMARMTTFADGSAPDVTEVPDPYYGGSDGFRHVFDLLDQVCDGVLGHFRNRLGIDA